MNPKYYNWYFVLSIFYGILMIVWGLLERTIALDSTFGNFLLNLIYAIGIGWLVLSIILLSRFFRYDFPAKYRFLPIYYIAVFALDMFIGLVIAIIALSKGILDPYEAIATMPAWTSYLAILESIFAICYSFYILLKK